MVIPIVEQSCSVGNTTGASSLDKRNRKKRAAKDVSPDAVMMSKKWKLDPDVDAFYTKYIRNKYFKPNKE